MQVHPKPQSMLRALTKNVSYLGLHGSRIDAHMPLWVVPSPLTPSTNHRLGVRSRHQELLRCALDGFLGPFLELEKLTRILRHLH